MDFNPEIVSPAVPHVESLREKLDRILGPQKLWLHCTLFVLTFFTCCVAGVEWRGIADPTDLRNLGLGVEYASLLLLFLSAHEFGHFIAARIHGVDATLPYYIPFPFSAGSLNFGTFGAVIRTRTKVPSNKVMFDIGVAGPIAGFLVCIALLAIGFATLPGIEYLQRIHPGYPQYSQPGGVELAFGNTLLFSVLEKFFANAHGYLPPMTEIYHYPMLCAGWFGLFVTTLNLLPIGQLDGGHLTYTLFGRTAHRRLGQLTAIFLFAISIPDVLLELSAAGYINAPEWLTYLDVQGGSMWLLWALVTTFVIRFRHPETSDESPLDTRRKVIAYLTLLILVLCYTPTPIVIR